MRAEQAEQATQMLMKRMMTAQRDLLVGTPTAGGNLVATELLASSFIDILVNQMKVMGMGATMLTDLQGNIAIPRATAGSVGYWVAENIPSTESQQAFDQVALTPKTAGAFVDYSRRLLLQSSIAVEAFVRMDIARSIALMIDLAAIMGTGASNQPRGLLNTAGIGSVAGGVNGAAPTWDNMVDLESAVANANADTGSMGYLTNTRVRGRLKRTQKFTGTNGQEIWQNGAINGYRAEVSNQVPSNLTKGTSNGVCSAILFGNWRDLIIGMWGGLDIMLDPYTGATAGTKRVIALQDVDVNVRYPVSFAAMQDALTV
jgi:HK97 family phage major capsid protein